MNEACRLNLSFDTKYLQGLQLVEYRTVTRHQKYAKRQAKTYNLLPVKVLLLPGKRAKDYIISQLPGDILRVEVPDVSILSMEPPEDIARPMIGAHVDLHRVATLNYYLEAHNEITTFYDWVGGDVTPRSDFCASTGSVYILDVTKPHSVSMHPRITRRVLTMSFFHTSFESLRRICAPYVY